MIRWLGGYDGRSNDYDSGYGHVNPLSALVAPLAALALLGAAAAVSTSPVLLSLAVLTNGRKRRDLNAVDNADIAPEIQEKLREIEVLEKYIAKVNSSVPFFIHSTPAFPQLQILRLSRWAGSRAREATGEADGHLHVLFGLHWGRKHVHGARRMRILGDAQQDGPSREGHHLHVSDRSFFSFGNLKLVTTLLTDQFIKSNQCLREKESAGLNTGK